MRAAVVLLFLIACGRFGFDATGGGDGDGGTSGDGDSGGDDTGPTGPRWIKRFGASTNFGLAGQRGEVVAVTSFATTFSDDGISVTGLGGVSSVFARWAADGTITDSRVFDAEFFCDMRAVVFDGDAVVLGGLTAGSAIPARGICSVATGNQDPLLIRIDESGNESILSHWSASTTNAQIWHAARYGGGQIIASGVYSGGLTLDTTLPMALADPNAFIGQHLGGTPTSAAWSKALVSADVVYPGPIDTAGPRGYLLGGFATDTTLLSTPLNNVGGLDAFIARVDQDGSVIFVKVIGSTVNEPDFGDDQSVAALASGGVAVTTRAGGDVTFDGQSFPVSDGPYLLLVLDGSGALQYGKRLPADVRVAAIGDTLYAAFTVSSPTSVGGMMHNPQGLDVLVVELDGGGAPMRIVGVIGGTGDQVVTHLVASAPDALAIAGVTNGALTFGATNFTTGGTDTHFIASLGL